MAFFQLAVLSVRNSSAATITVIGKCTLPDAIRAAEADASVGKCAAGSGPDTILLTGDVVLETVLEVDSGNNGLPTVHSELMIEGNGHAIRRDPAAADSFRLIRVAGKLTANRVVFEGGRAGEKGGAVLSEGELVLRRCQFLDNWAGEQGGAILHDPGVNLGALRIERSEFIGNRATGLATDADGGAIAHLSGNLVVQNSTFSNNRAGSESAFTGTAQGGALYLAAAATLTLSTFAANRSVGLTHGLGGAILAVHRPLVVVSTVSGNVSSSPASGALEGDFVAIHTTFFGNQPSGAVGYVNGPSPEDRSALLRGLFVGSSGANCQGPLAGGNNGDDDGTCPAAIAVAPTSVDPQLADNGGVTATHSLRAGSEAIDAGTCPEPAVDQRFAPHVGPCDLGAFEYLGCPTLLLSDDTVTGSEVHEECTVYAGSNYAVVGPHGDLTLRVGTRAVFSNGFSVGVDGQLVVELDPSLQLLEPGLIAADRKRRQERSGSPR